MGESFQLHLVNCSFAFFKGMSIISLTRSSAGKNCVVAVHITQLKKIVHFLTRF